MEQEQIVNNNNNNNSNNQDNAVESKAQRSGRGRGRGGRGRGRGGRGGRGGRRTIVTKDENGNTTTRRRAPAHNTNRRKRNTDSFEPSHEAPDMRVVIDLSKDKLATPMSVRDVVACPNLFTQPGDETIYARLVAELEKCSVPQDKLMLPWHGATHIIADDKTGFADECPTYKMVVERVAKYFGIKVNASRYSYFKDTDAFKPSLHDAAAFRTELAKVQNVSVAVSFGLPRDLDFSSKDDDNKKVIRFPAGNGACYVYGRDTNCMWRHGVPQVAPANRKEEGHVSINVWGWSEQVEYDQLA